MARQEVSAGSKAMMCSRSKKSVPYYAHDPVHRLLPAEAADAAVGDAEFTCGGCLIAGAGRRYRCAHPGCGFTLHESCALRSPRTLRSPLHPQHLLRRRASAAAGAASACHVCGEDVKGACYACAACAGGGVAVLVHPLCARLPASARGPAHPAGGHEAWLVRSAAAEGTGCAACGRPLLGGGWRYRCATCGAELHPRCMVPAAEQCRGGGEGGAGEEGEESVVRWCCCGMLRDLTRCLATLGTALHYRGYYNG